MVSRRKILSRSMDDLNLDQTYAQEEEEDVWYQKEKLYKEHIQEVLNKWTQIDDEIWAKVIVFERNRRVAKAYARAPCLTINGANDGFDGMRIGLCGFDNPMRDTQTDEVKKRIDQGAKIKMDDYGNIFIKRYANSNVFVKSTALNPNDENSIGTDILKLQNHALEKGETYKLFDMRKFHHNMNAEFRRSYPDRQRLETQCLSALVFVKQENDILDCPVWILVVNVVAMALLKSKLAPIPRNRPTPLDIKNRPRIPIPDEDPYSIAAANNSLGYISGNNSSIASTRQQLLQQSQKLAQKRSEKPPKLPPRDNSIYGHDNIPKPDYDDLELENKLKLSRSKNGVEKERNGKDKKYDDPYYCGLRARVPNFVKSKSTSKDKEKEKEKATAAALATAAQQQLSKKEQQQQARSQKKTSMIHHPSSSTSTSSSTAAAAALYHHQQQQLMAAAAAAGGAAHHPHYPSFHHANNHLNHHIIWQSKSYDSGMDSPDNTIESPYNRIYGRLPLPTRGYVPGPRVAYIGEWD